MPNGRLRGAPALGARQRAAAALSPRPMRRLAPALLAGLLAMPAVAAEAPRAAVEAAAATSEDFEDWALRCAGECRLRTELRNADGAPVLVLALARGEADALRLTVRTPLQLYLPDGLSLAVGESVSADRPWATCDAAGCEAWLAAEGDLLAALRRERAATIGFTLVDGTRVRLAASLMGFTAGERALRAAAP